MASGVRQATAPASRAMWRCSALCLGLDPGLFFPEGKDSPVPAIAVCRQCPVRVECLDWALAESKAPAGVWGGTTVRERRGLRRDRKFLAEQDRRNRKSTNTGENR